MKPTKLNILGKNYTIKYAKNPASVDLHQRESLWGQVDYWTRTIRIYDNKRTVDDLWHTILHEVLHCLAVDLKISLGQEDKHEELDLLAMGLSDFLIRNNLLKSSLV